MISESKNGGASSGMPLVLHTSEFGDNPTFVSRALFIRDIKIREDATKRKYAFFLMRDGDGKNVTGLFYTEDLESLVKTIPKLISRACKISGDLEMFRGVPSIHIKAINPYTEAEETELLKHAFPLRVDGLHKSSSEVLQSLFSDNPANLDMGYFETALALHPTFKAIINAGLMNESVLFPDAPAGILTAVCKLMLSEDCNVLGVTLNLESQTLRAACIAMILFSGALYGQDTEDLKNRSIFTVTRVMDLLSKMKMVSMPEVSKGIIAEMLSKFCEYYLGNHDQKSIIVSLFMGIGNALSSASADMSLGLFSTDKAVKVNEIYMSR